MLIHGKEYTEVKDRIPALLSLHPEACITTEVYWHNEDFSKLVMKASVKVGERVFTGWSYEERSQRTQEVNATSWVENCETSAIGRALANMNIGVAGARPSAEEMQKVERFKKEMDAQPIPIIDDGPLVAKIETALKKEKDADKRKVMRGRIDVLLTNGELTEASHKYLLKFFGDAA